MIQSFRSKTEFYSLAELVKDVLDLTGYLKELEESDEEDAADRIENIDELVNKVVAYEEDHDEPTLSEFLEEVALVADIDRVDEESDRVLLMTLHSAKGLEFSQVYLAGMEDGVFPGYMSITSDDPLEIEEERRLAYVGITRAKEQLTLTCAKQRMTRGETQYNPVSRFVREIPPLLLDSTPTPARQRREETYEEDSRERNRLRTRPYAAAGPARTKEVPVGGRPFGGVGFGKSVSSIKEKQPPKFSGPVRTGAAANAAGSGAASGSVRSETAAGP